MIEKRTPGRAWNYKPQYKQRVVTVRLSSEEYEHLRGRARAAGVSVNCFVRHKLSYDELPAPEADDAA